jgi:transposase
VAQNFGSSIDRSNCRERNPMLRPHQPVVFSETDRRVFDALVRRDHYLRRAEKLIDFRALGEALVSFYSAHEGRPAEDPVLMLKLEFLQYHDNLSDRQVIRHAETDVAYRWFLGLSLADDLPDPSLLARFRGRLGAEGHKQVLQQIIGQARNHNLVKDRLRLKDATHVIADIDIPSTRALVAHTRDRLLAAASHFDALRTKGERVRCEAIRQSTAEASDKSRLLARLTHLSEILEWTSELPAPENVDQNLRWQELVLAREIAAKVLGEADDSKASGRTLSTVDPDARRGKHGEFFDGYLVDVLIDADSELITAINVFPAGGDEALDTLELLDQEQAVHGNRVEAVSIDGIGFNGPLLRELESERGINAIVPPPVERASEYFTPDDFQEDTDRGVLTCPAGQESKYAQRDNQRHTMVYRFAAAICTACPLMAKCLAKPPEKTFGRTVRKNDYKAEYARARAKVTTAEYAAIRREHPKIERKLSELVRRHGCRQARYRGRLRVWTQQLQAAVAANIKRIVHLLNGANPLTVFA